MSIPVEYLHYGTIAVTVGLNAASVGIGEGIAGVAALQAIDIQPSARSDITKLTIIGMALIETSAIIGVSLAAMLLFNGTQPLTIYTGIAELGIASALSFTGVGVALAAAFPTRQACLAIARQPFLSKKILYCMMIMQSVIQTPIIFGFISALFIKSQMFILTSYPESIRLLAAGICLGLGSIGPVIGLGKFSQQMCRNLGINRHAYDRLFGYMIISQAIIETPIILALTISLLLLFSTEATDLLSAITFLCAAFCIGLGTCGTGISAGNVAAATSEQIAYAPERASELSRTSMLVQGIIDTCVIYTFVIAIMLIFWH